eukprot:234255_1
MLFITFFACILVLFEVNYAQTIPATMSDADTEYYITGASNVFSHGYIACSGTKRNCKIQCINDNACTGTTINATFAQNLVLECNGTYACNGITAYGPTTSADVQCLSSVACYLASFEFDDTRSVNLYCNDVGATSSSPCKYVTVNAAKTQVLDVQCINQYACRDAQFHATFANHSVNLFCQDTYSCRGVNVYALNASEVNIVCNDSLSTGSCYYLDVFCPSQRENQCNFDCGTGATKSCHSVVVYTEDDYTVGFMNVSMDNCSSSTAEDCSNFYVACISDCSEFDVLCISSGLSTEYYYTPTEGSLCTSYDCCPLSDYAPNVTCSDGEDCIINCTLSDPLEFGVHCQNQEIDATLANSLTLFCESSESCRSATVLCPEGNNTNCNIQCVADSACQYTRIKAALTQNIALQCDGSYACNEINVTGATSSADVRCVSYNACVDGVFEFDDTESVNIHCNDISGDYRSFACSRIEVNAVNTRDLDIQCMEEYACRYAQLNVTFANHSVNILCNDIYACRDVDVYGLKANQVNIICNDSVSSGSCGYLTVYCPSERENQCHFDCGAGDRKVCSMIDIYTNDDFTVGFMNVFMDACSSSTASDCSEFDIFCISSGLSSDYYYTPTEGESLCTSYDCCPISDYKVNVTCSDGEDCIINCTLNDPFGVNCQNQEIDATNAKSLTLFCEGSESCKSATVLCPGGNCTVVCGRDISYDDACLQLTIDASASNYTNIQCLGGCESMSVDATYSAKVDILCTGWCRSSSFNVDNSETVNLICNGETSSSNGVDLYANYVTNVNVLCNTTSVCSSLEIRGIGSESINVDCMDSWSCNSIKLFCPSTENACKLNCADTNTISAGSCKDATIFFKSQSVLDPFAPILDLSCPQNAVDCDGVQFHCNNYNEPSNGVYYSFNEPTSYAWDETTQQRYCLLEMQNWNYFCCAAHNEILCEPNQDCNVYCNDTTIAPQCASTVINAKNASSLSVSCANGRCYGAHIECPSESGTSCAVECGTPSGTYTAGCYFSTFNGNGATQIDIHCHLCAYMTVDVISADSITNLNCSGGMLSGMLTGCYDLEYTNTGNNAISNVNCGGVDSCSNIYINANASDSVSLSCDEQWSCISSTLDVAAANVTIDCNAFESCKNIYWDLHESQQVTINPNANYTFNFENDWYRIIPPYNHSNSTHINCGMHTECYGLYIKIEDQIGANFLDISCDDTVNGCPDVAVSCYPDPGYSTSSTAYLISTTDEYYCDTTQSMDCCPFFAPTKNPSSQPTEAPFTTDNPSKQPTESPTKQPSMTPTKNPTANPVVARITTTVDVITSTNADQLTTTAAREASTTLGVTQGTETESSTIAESTNALQSTTEEPPQVNVSTTVGMTQATTTESKTSTSGESSNVTESTNVLQSTTEEPPQATESTKTIVSAETSAVSQDTTTTREPNSASYVSLSILFFFPIIFCL